MKVAIISSIDSNNTLDLVNEFNDRSIEVSIFRMADISYDTASAQTEGFYSNDVFIFRGYNKFYHHAQSIAVNLNLMEKVVIDRVLYSKFIPSKLHETILYTHHGINHPRTIYLRSSSQIESLNLDFPVVVKDIDSQKGTGVRLSNNDHELRKEVDLNGSNIVIQQFIPMQYDIRTIIVGGKVVGAIKRFVPVGDFRSNISLGSRSQAHVMTQEETDIALSAHNALGYDISGVDIGRSSEGTPFVIETNISPEWQGFKKTTGISVARFIVEYAVERYENAKK